MRIIDLLNKIANGEEMPKRIRIDHWCYKFEWIEHQSNYYDKDNEIDLMSCLSCDKEELNYEVHELEEEKKIPEKLETYKEVDDEDSYANILKVSKNGEYEIDEATSVIVDKINEILKYLDYLKSKGE